MNPDKADRASEWLERWRIDNGLPALKALPAYREVRRCTVVSKEASMWPLKDNTIYFKGDLSPEERGLND